MVVTLFGIVTDSISFEANAPHPPPGAVNGSRPIILTATPSISEGMTTFLEHVELYFVISPFA